MNDYDWVASKLTKEQTNDYYCKEFSDDNDIENVTECNLDTEGMWWETNDKADIKTLGDNDEFIQDNKKCTIGDLMRRGNDTYKIIPFRKAITLMGDYSEPYIISTTEW